MEVLTRSSLSMQRHTGSTGVSLEAIDDTDRPGGLESVVGRCIIVTICYISKETTIP
jgi:hypothetical protein